MGFETLTSGDLERAILSHEPGLNSEPLVRLESLRHVSAGFLSKHDLLKKTAGVVQRVDSPCLGSDAHLFAFVMLEGKGSEFGCKDIEKAL